MWEWNLVQWVDHSSYVGVEFSSVGRFARLMWEWNLVQWVDRLSYVGVVCSSVGRLLILCGSGI